MRTKRSRLLLLLTVLAMVLAACGGGDGGGATDSTGTTAGDSENTTTTADSGTDTTEAEPTEEPVTIEWWHIQNNDPGLSLWQAVADEFMAEHPNVTIDITVQENEAFKQALQTSLQAGDVPDIFQSWGGGGLREQVDAGLVMDITDAAAGFDSEFNGAAASMMQIDGRMYGVPFDLGIVGVWYNKALFEEAGIDGPPATWDEMLEDVQTLKDAGITPIAVGAGDKWPAHFYYSYLMIREGGQAAMDEVTATLDFNTPEFIEAGNQLQRLIDMEPFQAGFLAAPWDAPDGESGTIGTGQAAISLMGQWGPGAYANQSGIGVPEDPIPDRLPGEFGWFPFPAVEGGAGAATDGFGGGDGFAVGKDAPPEAVQFLEYISSVDQAIRTGETGTTLPVTKGAEVSITDPYQLAVLEGLSNASFVQLYLDQFFTPELGAAVNDAVATLFAGTATPEEVTEAITAAAG